MLKKVVSLAVDGVALSGVLYLLDDKTRYPAVCLCHGIPSGKPRDPGDGGYPLLAEKLCQEGFTVLFFNFRGAGDSGGNFDMLGWTRDLTAAIDLLWGLSEVDKSRLALLGFSGGAAVSVCVAAEDNRVSWVAACACPAELKFLSEAGGLASSISYFRSIGLIRDADFPRSAEEWAEGFRLVSPIKHISQITPRPVLIVHGSKDDLVDVSHAHRLYEAAHEPKKLVLIDGAGHRLRRDEKAMVAVFDWLKVQAGINNQ